ncbi:hypothetical protein Tco_0628536 [Tanacetum coccineum]|uniref:Uncharacterized protein n=1 Tax=Tanacetum coccineum TaxID=301880 RepID=A0ABQ4WQL1_9ASTR
MMTVIRMVSVVGSSRGSNGGCGVLMERRQQGGATVKESGGEGNDGVGAEVESLEPGFELQGAKMVEMGRFG